MSKSAVVGLLRAALKLCAKFLDAQTDPAIIKELTGAIDEIESAIVLLEKDGSAIRLDGPAAP